MSDMEAKMRELLYDFRRYFEQLKEEGVEWVITDHEPDEEQIGLRPSSPSGRAPSPSVSQQELFSSPGKEKKAIKLEKPAFSSDESAVSPAENFRILVEKIKNCRRCGLASTRNRVVPGEGGNKKRILFIGEGPGAEEDRQGRPFVGRSGQLLDKILASISLSRDDIFITNIVKCRPPGNRDPGAEEVIACWPYLEEQIEILKPRVIVTLGSPAAKTLLDTSTGIGRLRGRFHDYHGVPLLPTYHPAYLLRTYTIENRKKVWEDMKILRGFLDEHDD